MNCLGKTGLFIRIFDIMGTSIKIWDRIFNNEVLNNFRISFCITCMNRLHNLKLTLPKNIENNKSYGNVEFVLLDYNSKDGLEEWVKSNMMGYIESGLMVYYKTVEPKYFSMSHSRNVAFKVASGDIVNNLDADNFVFKDGVSTTECLASYINRMANDCREKVIFAKGKRYMHGRIGFYKKEFIDILGGYDEQLLGYGHDDHDIVGRAWAQNFIMYWWGGAYYSRIKTSRKEKDQNMERHWKITENENKVKSAANISIGKVKANLGVDWGKSHLVKNFKEEIDI